MSLSLERQPLFERLRTRGVGLVDVHVHGFLDESLNTLLVKALGVFNIERAFVSIHPFDLGSVSPGHAEVLRGNEKILELTRRERSLRGLVYVNLLNPEDLDMTERFLREGFAGIGEVYRSVRPRRKLIEPYIRLAIEYDVPILIHTAHRLYPGYRAREATIEDLCRVAKWWPRARIVVSHICGGGDWEHTIEYLRLCGAGNLYIDTGGSVGDAGVVERLVGGFYRENILFGSDNVFTTSIARIEASEIDDDIKTAIYRDNPCRVFSCD